METRFMERALKLAEKGRGKVSPNPIVGCVIAKKGRVIAEAGHAKYGGMHAEAAALKKAGKRAKGADMYVTLEPCPHWGKTPPCTEAIIKAGIKRVFAAMKDPNPRVKGRGVKKLRASGVPTVLGICKKEAEMLNDFYITYMLKKRPFVIMKVAMTADGKITWGNGKRKNVSGKEAKEFVHNLRADVDAVAVGINTVIKDNPRLTARLGEKQGGNKKAECKKAKCRNPLRIVFDSSLKIPLNARILKGVKTAGTTIITTGKSKNKKRKAIEIQKRGAGVIIVKAGQERVDLRSALAELGKAGISSLLLEGGNKINTAFLREGLADKIAFIVSARRVGKGLDWADARVLGKIKIRDLKVSALGNDLLIEGRPEA
ncbi:MAG: bifunctional diaminohydroxyphosphoribosylaminopyrimidine deaminase/5-amino-6-(5-phosphoribosylamino)uracil reductase RibD [Candidatus Diapherotrites archaeon]